MNLRPIKGFENAEGYYARPDGTVWSDRTGRLKQIKQRWSEHHNAVVVKNGLKVAHIMLYAFVSLRPAGQWCSFKDGDRRNVSLSNLCWSKRDITQRAKEIVSRIAVSHGPHQIVRALGITMKTFHWHAQRAEMAVRKIFSIPGDNRDVLFTRYAIHRAINMN